MAQNWQTDLWRHTAFLQMINTLLQSVDAVSTEMRETLDALLQDGFRLLSASQSHDRKLKVAIIGLFSSGKSSFINWILGEEVCPVDLKPTTSSITEFVYGPKQRFLQAPIGEAVPKYKEISRNEYRKRVRHEDVGTNTTRYQFRVEYPYDGFRNLIIADTPGFDNPASAMDAEITTGAKSKITTGATQNADIVFVVVDVNNGAINRTLKDILTKVKEQGKPDAKWYLILSHADTVPASEARKPAEIILKEHTYFEPNFFLVDASTPTDPWTRLEKTVCARIQTARERYNAREDVLFEIRVEQEGRQLYTYLDGAKSKLATKRRAGLANRHELHTLFSQFSSHLRENASSTQYRNISIYSKRWNRCLDELKDELTIFLDRNPNDFKENSSRPLKFDFEVFRQLYRELTYSTYLYGLERKSRLIRDRNTIYSIGRVYSDSVSKHGSVYFSEYFVQSNFRKASTRFYESCEWDEIVEMVTLAFKNTGIRVDAILKEIHQEWMRDFEEANMELVDADLCNIQRFYDKRANLAYTHADQLTDQLVAWFDEIWHVGAVQYVRSSAEYQRPNHSMNHTAYKLAEVILGLVETRPVY